LQPFDTEKQTFIIPSNINKINPDNTFLNKLQFSISDEETNSTTQDEYIDYVKSSIENIKKEEIKKVVPARVKSVSKLSNPLEIFKNACSNYPNAFVSLTSTEKTGTWVGATPEVLLTIDKDKSLNTVALAGTQNSNGKYPSEAVWTQKEIEEQALVSRYIINCFKEIRLREFEENGPKTIQAGNLFHLKSTYKIKLADVDYSDLGSMLIKLLHPTSAVAGMPREAALNFIKENENFDRELYSGFIGPVNYKDESKLFVNLRCSKINKNNILLFAGAGVTEDSNPKKEWLETEQKCNIIESLIS